MKVLSTSFLVLLFVITMAMSMMTSSVFSMYVPTFPRNLYKQDDIVNIRVNSLRSSHDLVPYDFYKFPYCKPEGGPQSVQESLGELLFGDNMQTSPYALKFLRNVTCARVKPCDANTPALVNKSIVDFQKFIEDGYRAHMSIDNLPGYNPGVMMFNGNCKYAVPATYESLFRRGFAMGVPKRCNGETLLNNHLQFTVKYHESEPDAADGRKFTIVGFTIVPQSVNFRGDNSDCNDALRVPSASNPNPDNYPGALKIADIRSGASKAYFTYSVNWEYSNVRWITRWDAYLSTSFADQNTLIHWEYIIVSMALTFLVSGVATHLLLRALKIDCAKFNSDDPEERQEEFGWKYVHSDVFRKPDRLNFLAMVVGNGVQIVLTLVVVLAIGLFGFLSPANRGGLLTTAILLFVLMSFPAGYVCAMVQKMFDVKEWRTVFGCAFLFPGELFFCWFFQDLLSWHMGASNAIPFTTVLGLFVLWLAISTPLTILGSSFAWHHDKITFPVEVGKMAREIPVQRWYYTSPFILVGPGLIPFMIVFLELKFIFNSIWLGYVYYVFGFLAITVFLWMYTAALTSITAVYYQLAYEDWRWWWRAFFVPSGCGVYVVLYCFYFYTSVLSIKSNAGAFMFWTYSLLFTGAYVLAAGAIGSVACLLFVRKIYGSIRID